MFGVRTVSTSSVHGSPTRKTPPGSSATSSKKASLSEEKDRGLIKAIVENFKIAPDTSDNYKQLAQELINIQDQNAVHEKFSQLLLENDFDRLKLSMNLALLKNVLESGSDTPLSNILKHLEGIKLLKSLLTTDEKIFLLKNFKSYRNLSSKLGDAWSEEYTKEWELICCESFVDHVIWHRDILNDAEKWLVDQLAQTQIEETQFTGLLNEIEKSIEDKLINPNTFWQCLKDTKLSTGFQKSELIKLVKKNPFWFRDLGCRAFFKDELNFSDTFYMELHCRQGGHFDKNANDWLIDLFTKPINDDSEEDKNKFNAYLSETENALKNDRLNAGLFLLAFQNYLERKDNENNLSKFQKRKLRELYGLAKGQAEKKVASVLNNAERPSQSLHQFRLKMASRNSSPSDIVSPVTPFVPKTVEQLLENNELLELRNRLYSPKTMEVTLDILLQQDFRLIKLLVLRTKNVDTETDKDQAINACNIVNVLFLANPINFLKKCHDNKCLKSGVDLLIQQKAFTHLIGTDKNLLLLKEELNNTTLNESNIKSNITWLTTIIETANIHNCKIDLQTAVASHPENQQEKLRKLVEKDTHSDDVILPQSSAKSSSLKWFSSGLWWLISCLNPFACLCACGGGSKNKAPKEEHHHDAANAAVVGTFHHGNPEAYVKVPHADDSSVSQERVKGHN